MHVPRTFKLNLALTSLGFVTLSASRLAAPVLKKHQRSTMEGVGLALIGVGEAAKLVRNEKESQRAAERAKTTDRALNRILARIESQPRVTKASRRRAAKPRKLEEHRVAAILDEFSYHSFALECQLIPITPGNWRERFEQEQPDLFFCESAWSGSDPIARPWRGKIYASENFSHENRSALLDILQYCKREGIPTVFWNKEDPSHFDDRAHNFVATATHFDHIFTTDAACVPRYQQEYGHPSVHVLQFAAQPKLFNPIEITRRSDDAVFAGGWYDNHVERSKDMVTIFDAVIASGHNLKIYDRYANFADDTTHIFPRRYQPYINPPVPGDQVAKVYKESTLGITLNTETESETMFARRIFELMACNTFVISNYSRGVDQLFGDTVLFLDQHPEDLRVLSTLRIDDARHRNLKTVLRDHTYRHRFEQIARVAGLEFAPTEPAVAATAVVTDPAQSEAAFTYLRQLSGPYVVAKILLVGPTVEPFDYGLLLRDYNQDGVQVIRFAEDAPRRGEVLSATEVDHFLVFPAATLPDPLNLEDTLEDLLLHAQYAPGAITMAHSQQPFTFVTQSLKDTVLIPAVAAEPTLGAVIANLPFEQLLIA